MVCTKSRDYVFALPKGRVRAVLALKIYLGDRERIEGRKDRIISSGGLREGNKGNVVEITGLGARARCA